MIIIIILIIIIHEEGAELGRRISLPGGGSGKLGRLWRRLPRPEVGPVHPEQERCLWLALLGVALDHAAAVADALQARPASLLHHLAHLVEAAVHVAAFDFHRGLKHLLPKPRSWCRRRRSRGRCNTYVLHCHVHRALVSRTAEAADGRLETLRYGRWAGLLQANDVPAEAEAEVARVRPRDLLGRLVHLGVEDARSFLYYYCSFGSC